MKARITPSPTAHGQSDPQTKTKATARMPLTIAATNGADGFRYRGGIRPSANENAIRQHRPTTRGGNKHNSQPARWGGELKITRYTKTGTTGARRHTTHS